MPSIDERVVAMSFENAKFEAGVAQTMATLSKLDVSIKNIGSTSGLQNIEAQANKVTLQAPMSALDKLKAKLGMAGQGAAEGLGDIDRAGNKVTLEGPSNALDKLQGKMGQLNAGATFTDIEKASDRVTLSGLTGALDSVTAKFSVLQGAASVALGGIAAQATMRGGAFAKSFAFGPINQGLEEYQTNLNSIQTILANTEGQQVSGLQAVNEHLAELNTYSDQTIYNFSQMAKNIGTFTAAGVDLDTSTQSIKGIANLAALSGSSSQQASVAMYQLSQAIAAGRVGLQDWNSVVNAGMGGAKFQQALLRTADNMGALEKGALKIDQATGKATVNGQSFRESIMAKPGEQSWLTSEVLTNTLQQFTGDMKEADLIAQGFSKTQAHSIMLQAETAKAAATEVKTLSQVFDVARESIGSGWAKTFQLVFGDFEEAKKTFTELSNFINTFIGKNADARNAVLQEWKDLGGREKLIEGLKNVFAALSQVLGSVSKAFRDVFPAKTGADLFSMTKSFADFAKSLIPSEETLRNLRRTFQGFFAVVSIGISIVKGIAGVIFDLLGVVGKGSGSFLEFTGGIGDFLSRVDVAIKKGGALTGFFDGLTAVLKLPVELLKGLAGAIGDLFGADTDSSDIESSLDGVKTSAKPLADILDKLSASWDTLVEALNDVKGAVAPVLNSIVDEIRGFAGLVANAIETMDWDSVFLALQTTFIGGLFLAIKKAIGGGIEGIGGGVLENVNGILKGVTGNLEAMQKNIQAGTLLKIAAAIGVLAAGIFLLSTIDPTALTRAMTAVAVGMGQLIVAMKLITSGGLGTSVVIMPVIAASLIALSVALVILAGAMKIMATMDWEELAKGLTGLGGALAAVGLGVKLIGPSVIPAALAMIPLAIGLNLLAVAVKQFAGLDWEEMARGLAGVAGALLSVAAGMVLMPPTLPVTAAGILILSAGLILLSGAVASFGNLNPKALAQGIIGIGLALSAIGLAVALIPPTLALQAAGLVILGVALTGIAAAVGIFGSMNLAKLAKGIATLAGVLIVLGVGLTAMSGTLAGSAALLIAAGALSVLAPTLGFLGTLEWSTIFKGLAAIVLVLGTLAIVGVAASTGLVALGGGLAVLGLGMTTIAAAVYLAAKGISLLAENGQKGVAALLVALTGFVAIFPTIVIQFLKGLLEIAEGIAEIAPKIIIALGVIIDTIIAFVIESAPKLAVAIGVLILSFLTVINENAPRIIAAGFKLLMDFLSGIENNVGQVVSKVLNIITAFLTALITNAPRVVDSGAKMLVAFLSGIASKIGQVVAEAVQVVGNFLRGIASKIPNVIAAAVNLILSFVKGLAGQVPRVITMGTTILLKLIEGLGNAVGRLIRKAVEIVGRLLKTIANELVNLVDVGFKAMIRFINGMARTVRENDKPLVDAFMNLGDAIVDALVLAIKTAGPKVFDAVTDIAGGAVNAFKNKLGIFSPSKVFMELGGYVGEGLTKGISGSGTGVNKSMVNLGNGALNSFKDKFGSPILRELGKEVGQGFAKGLEGSATDIRSAFQSLNDKLKTQIRTSKENIASEQAKLDDLLKAKKPDYEAINAAQKAVLENERILKASKAAHEELTVSLQDEKKELIGLTNEYDGVTRKLEEAQRVLDEATRARDDAQRSYRDKYSATPTIELDSETALADYKKSLQERIVATQKYAETLQKLRAAGLDDTTYKKLLEQGTEGQAFAEQLLAGGKTAIDGLNQLDAQLLTVSSKLAQDASANLYQAGVDAAQGLVNGLASRQKELETLMENLANSMVAAIKRKLKIRSPSQIFGEVGKFAVEGLAKGFQDSSKTAIDAASELGADTMSALQSSVAGISSAISENIEVDPVITPVLDLSNIERNAKKLDGLTNVTPITAAASYGQAAAISEEKQDSETAQAAQAAQAGPTLNFEQNNYSPESLSDVEIYRQTRNQLAQVKTALGLVQ